MKFYDSFFSIVFGIAIAANGAADDIAAIPKGIDSKFAKANGRLAKGSTVLRGVAEAAKVANFAKDEAALHIVGAGGGVGKGPVAAKFAENEVNFPEGLSERTVLNERASRAEGGVDMAPAIADGDKDEAAVPKVVDPEFARGEEGIGEGHNEANFVVDGPSATNGAKDEDFAPKVVADKPTDELAEAEGDIGEGPNAANTAKEKLAAPEVLKVGEGILVDGPSALRGVVGADSADAKDAIVEPGLANERKERALKGEEYPLIRRTGRKLEKGGGGDGNPTLACDCTRRNCVAPDNEPQGSSDWVAYCNGVEMFGTCEGERGEMQCCGVSKACGGFTGWVKKDNISCMGNYACYNAEIPLVENSCNGEYACNSAGSGGEVGSFGNSCVGGFSCSYAGAGGTLGSLSSSCHGDFACSGLAYHGDVGDLLRSCCGDPTSDSGVCEEHCYDGKQLIGLPAFGSDLIDEKNDGTC